MKKREKLDIIRKWYPNAVSTVDNVNKLIDFIEWELDLEPMKVMIADSVCSDDVNSIQYPVRAREFLGPFKMGGLDGFPFTGLTGMAAIASHIPDDGAVFISYGPHIGISKTGVIGEIHRFGQSKPTSCCGAAKIALAKLKNNLITAGYVTELDYQMNTLEQILYAQKDRILQAENQIFEATEVIYEAINARIGQLLEQTQFHCRYILLRGAIIINSDSDMGSFTSAKHFYLIDVANNTRTDLISKI